VDANVSYAVLMDGCVHAKENAKNAKNREKTQNSKGVIMSDQGFVSGFGRKMRPQASGA
jgi:hypothetical protein